MCGIIGILATRNVTPLLIDGLSRLEYRGYDSAGICTLMDDGKLVSRRALGKLQALRDLIEDDPISGIIGIGHTRWATHGAPSTTNAHPHATDKVAVVHNGIIENYKKLRQKLEQEGAIFVTETDTEVIPHLITSFLNKGLSPVESVKSTLKELDGAFALAILFAGYDNLLIGARKGSPLAIGYGEGEMFIGSDAYALSMLTQRITYLEEGDMVVLDRDHAEIYNDQFEPVSRKIQLTYISGAPIGKGNFRHFMLKEIYEQPEVIGTTINALYNQATSEVNFPSCPFNLQDISRISIIACGTSFYSGAVAKYWLEQYARIPVDIDIASEYRYRHSMMDPNALCIFISQSGETADTLASLRHVKHHGLHTLAIVNSPESTISREADCTMFTRAGPEIGVASTKAFTCQLAALACFTFALAKARLPQAKWKAINDCEQALLETPSHIIQCLQRDKELHEIAKTMTESKGIILIGRGTNYPIALEGALKMKELSYIQSEGIAAGELKHGPIALIDDQYPVIVLAPHDHLIEKTVSNAQEVAARGGRIISITDEKGAGLLADISSKQIILPDTHPFISPIVYAIPVQLLAYHIAVLKGTDVDQPRNLAKSVTVE